MVVVALSLSGCKADPPPVYGDVLVPLEDANRAHWPTSADEPFPETLDVVAGEDDALFWAHARGYVHADLATVWAAARTIEVNVDRREVDRWSVTFDTVDGFDHSYTIHNEVDDVIDVNYDLTWVHQQQGGEATAPLRVVGRWDKTDGTAFIDVLSGSLELEQVAPDRTSVALQEHLKAALRDEETLVSYLTDLFDEIVAASHGEPLPNYE